MGVAKFASEELCAVHPSVGMDAIGAESQKIMSSIAGSKHGQIFTSETPKMKTTSCIPYPLKGAIFCSTLGHSHRVAPEFAERNFVRVRDRDVELAWTKLAQNEAMQRLMGHSGRVLRGLMSEQTISKMMVERMPFNSRLREAIIPSLTIKRGFDDVLEVWLKDVPKVYRIGFSLEKEPHPSSFIILFIVQ